MKVNLKGREADVEVVLEKHTCDSYFSSGYWVDTGEILIEDELILLEEENQDKIIEYAMENGGYRD